MATLNIGGQRVKVDDGFLSLSPADQQKTVDEIEASLGGTATSPPPAPAPAEAATAPAGVAATAPAPPALPVDIGMQIGEPPPERGPPVDRASKPNVPLGVQSTGAGLAELLGTIPDLSTGLLNVPIHAYNWIGGAMGAPQSPIFQAPSDALKNRAARITEDAGYRVRDPHTEMTLPEQAAYNVNRFGVQAAGMVPALAKVGAQRTADFLAGDIKHRWYDPLVRPYSGEQPFKTTAVDIAAAGGSGAGVTATDQLAPDNPLASYVGTLGGGAAGSTLGSAILSIPKLATNLGRSLLGLNRETAIPLDPSKPFAQQQAVPTNVFNKASEIFQNEAIDPKAAAQRIQETHADIAPYMSTTPTTPQMSQDTGLLLLEKELRSRNQGAYNEQTRALNSAARDTIEGVVPPGANREDLIGAARTEAINQRAAAQSGVENVQQRQQRVENIRRGQAEDLTPQANPPEAPSAALHQEIVDKSLRPMTTERNTRYEAIPDRPVSSRPIVDQAEALDAQLARLPQGFRQQVDPGNVLTGLKGMVDEDGNAVFVGLQTLQRMRNQLGEAEKTAHAAGQHILADNFGELRRGIAGMVDAHPAATEATQYTRETFSPVWGEQSPTARSFRKGFWNDPDTSSKVPPSQTGRTFIQPGAPEKTAELQRIIGSMADPQQAQTAARGVLMADLAKSGAVDAQGRLNPRAVEKWATNNQANLDLVPGLRQEVEGVIGRARRGTQLSERLTGDLRGAQTAQTLTEAQIKEGALGSVLNSDPKQAVGRIMSDPYRSGGKLDELIKLTEGNPQARAGLKQAVQDYILDKVTGTATEKMKAGDPRGPVSTAKIGQIISEHEDQLVKIFDAPEMNALRAVHKSLDLAKGGLASGQGATESVTRLHRNVFDEFRGTPIGRGLEAAARLHFGALTAGGKFAGIQRALHGVGGEQAVQIESLLMRAATDPEIAKLLLGREIPIGSPKWNKNLSRLMGYTEAARDISKKDNEEEGGPLKITVNPRAPP